MAAVPEFCAWCVAKEELHISSAHAEHSSTRGVENLPTISLSYQIRKIPGDLWTSLGEVTYPQETPFSFVRFSIDRAGTSVRFWETG